MAIKSYFQGKKGVIFWVNVIVMAMLLVALPMGGFFALNSFTHHGEKIEVPNVKGLTMSDAVDMLEDSGFEVVISDSVDCKDVKPGCVHEQTPRPGSEVKSGRLVYLITRYEGEPRVEFPALVGRHTYREAKQILKNLGFQLTPDELVEGQPEGYLVAVYQRGRMLITGDMVAKNYPLTIHVGAGEIDTLEVDSVVEDYYVDEEDYDF